MSNLQRAGAAALLILTVLLLSAQQNPARGEERTTVAARSQSESCQRAAFRVVVDVGHTLEEPGAISARGTAEYAFNLQLANEIRQTLVDAGFDKTVLLITATAPPTGLLERATHANRLPADLFISIHHDSVPDYLLETWQYEGQENHFSDRFSGYAIFISNDNGDRAGSLEFGKFLGKELNARDLHYTPHYTLALMRNRRRQLLDAKAGVYRYDQLIVLRDTRMPAVLLEAGSIINRKEELELASAARAPAPPSPRRLRIFARRARTDRADRPTNTRRRLPRGPPTSIRVGLSGNPFPRPERTFREKNRRLRE